MARSNWGRMITALFILGLLAAGQCAVEGEPGDNDAVDSGSDNWSAEPGLTVYVVDQPQAVDEFTELTDALAYLCAHLPDNAHGEAIIRTERPLPVETLTFDCSVAIKAEPGLFPIIQGPGLTPLVVNASGALGLTGLTITNSAGVLVNTAGGDLDLESNVISDGVTLNLGTLTTGKTIREQRDANESTNYKILSNNLGQGLKLNLGSNLGASSKCTVSENQGNTCTLSGNGSVSGELTYRSNLFRVIEIDTKLKASASLSVTEHQSLDSLKLNIQNSDTPQLKLANNVTASAKISLLGQASATLTLTGNDIQDGEVKFGVSDLKINALGTTYGRLAMLATAMVASPVLHYTEMDSTILGTFSFTALDAGTENARVTVNFNNVDAQSNFQVDVKCQARFVLSGDTAIRGSASIKVDGNVYELEEAKVRWDAGVVFEATGFNAGIKVASQAGTYKDGFNVFAQPTTTLSIELTDAIFQGGALSIGKTGAPQANQKRLRTAQSAGDAVTLSNLQWTESALAVGILDVEGPVTIENCQIDTSLQVISLASIRGPIAIRGNSFKARLAIYDCPESATVDGNTFAPNGGAGPDVWLWQARGLVQNNLMPNGLLVAGEAGYALTKNNQISGDVSVGSGGRLRLEANDLTGAQVGDDFAFGPGLVNDPVVDNSNLSPDNVYTPVDFNGNGCCDYPPANDERDGDGNCMCDGLAVPADPGL